MRYEFCFPVNGTTLDRYLAAGWYRYGFVMFTTDFTPLDETEKNYRVWWLRYQVQKVHFSNTIRRIESACKGFTVSCRPYQPGDEIETLYALYAQSLRFTVSASVEDLLGSASNLVFDSHMIEVRDNGRLIACGIFDLGNTAIAGIVNFYDPAYKKFSPGKFLIIQKLRYCIAHNITYYYPGYFSTDNPVFDYKLFLDKKATEVYLPQQENWVSVEGFVPE